MTHDQSILEAAIIGPIVGLALSGIAWRATRTPKEKANRAPAGSITPLMNAIIATKPRKIATLIDDGANVDAQDADGMTALMYAVTNDFYDAAAMLMQAGADPSLQNASGETALDLAKTRDAEDLATLIESQLK